MTNICKFCAKNFKNTYTLKNHQETAIYPLVSRFWIIFFLNLKYRLRKIL